MVEEEIDVVEEEEEAEEEMAVDFEEEELEDDEVTINKFSRRPKEIEDAPVPSFLDYFAPPTINDIDTVKDLDLFIVDIEHQKRGLPNDRYDDQEVAEERMIRHAYDEGMPSFSIRKRPREDIPMVPCIRLYCKTRSGGSVCLNTYGYYPVVHLLTSCTLIPTIVQEIRDKVEELFRQQDETSVYPKRRPEGWRAILDAKIVKGFPASPYSEKPYDFIEFKLADPSQIRTFGAMIRKAGEIETMATGYFRVMPYSCEDIIDKFQAARMISGCGWIRALGGRYHKTCYEDGRYGSGDETFCQTEFDIRYTDIVAFADDSIPPLRMITYDIECASTKGFPDAENIANPIIVIAAICTDYEHAEPVKSRKVVFQYGSADQLKDFDPMIGEQHMRFRTEKETLTAFGQLIKDYDPDFLGGHNMVGFDLPYVVTRANKLDCHPALYLGRRGAWKWQKPRRVVKKRKNGETRETKVTATPGRVQLDTLPWIQGDVMIKLRSYRLGAISQIYLGDTKDDVGYSMIVPMWKQSDATRSRLAKYCLKDTLLTQGLIDLDTKKKSFKMIMNCIEKSRQTRVCCNKLLKSGVQVRVWSLLLEKAKNPKFDDMGTEVFFPDEEIKQRDKDDKFRGAEVLEPFRGFYSRKKGIVGCGDFKSLYPSIIILLNICYTTEIPRHMIKYDKVPYKQSPVGTKLVDKSVRVGLLAQIEIELMGLRDVAKAKMVQAEKEGKLGLKSMYNSRQNEIKVNCNSLYGIMNASGGRLTRSQLAESVTSQGRDMIMQAKRIAEGLSPSNHVIYGDTDSIFVHFEGCTDKVEAFKILVKICDAVTATFPRPVMLQPEKVMQNVILTNKKRYLSALSTGPTAEPYLDVKGIEVARRDNCQMVVKTMTALLDKLILEDKPVEALDIINDTLRELLGGRVDISDLVITKAIAKDDYKGKPAHVAVAEKMKKRDPSYECNSGERIPFVVTINGGTKLYEKADDPLWVINHGIQLDYDYYIQNQLAGPCSRILMWILGHSDDMDSISKSENYLRKVQAATPDDIVVIAAAKKQLVKCIETMQKHVQAKLFGPSALSVHVRKIQSTAGQKGKIDSFFSRVVPKALSPSPIMPKCPKCNRESANAIICSFCAAHICFSCKAPVSDHGPCETCGRQIELRRKAIAAVACSDVEDIVALAAEAKAKCDKCRGYTDETEIKCVQKDCPNLYKRATLAARLKKRTTSEKK